MTITRWDGDRVRDRAPFRYFYDGIPRNVATVQRAKPLFVNLVSGRTQGGQTQSFGFGVQYAGRSTGGLNQIQAASV